MIKGVYSKYANEEGLRGSLILITVLSWFIFPLMAKQLNPSAFGIGFVIVAFAVIISVAIALTRNQLALQPLHKMMLVCWIGYLLALLLATMESASTYSLTQWCLLFAKFLFFAFLLFYINVKFIVATLRIYAKLMVLTVIFALVAVFVVAIGAQPLATVDLHGVLTNVYFGTYYVPNSPICMPAPIYRIQGLSEEPGTYAFALLPAFFWLLIAEKAYVRAAVIVLGLMLSMSFGAGLFLFLLLTLMARKNSSGYKVPVFFLSAICAIGFMYVVSTSCTKRYFENMDAAAAVAKNKEAPAAVAKNVEAPAAVVKNKEAPAAEGKIKEASAAETTVEACVKEGSQDRRACNEALIRSISTTASGKAHSFQDRAAGILAAWSYLRVHFMGTGTGLGMLTVNNSIAVGYAVAALEAGVVGGLFYLCLFAIMGWLAVRTIITTNNGSVEEQVKVVVALSVCAVLAMGAQRIQPDLSLWHMWIYAMWFYLLQKIPCSKVAG